MGSDTAKRVLIVHHTVSPSTAAIFDAARRGLEAEELGDLEIVTAAALDAPVTQTLAVDGVVLLSPVNIGYLSGAMKHYFDQLYYPALEETKKLPFAAVLHSNLDASGAVRALNGITGALEWRPVGDPLVISGDPTEEEIAAIEEIAGTLGAYATGML